MIGAQSLEHSGVVSDLRRLANRYFSRCGSYVFQGQPALQSLARNCERASSTPVIGIDHIIYQLTGLLLLTLAGCVWRGPAPRLPAGAYMSVSKAFPPSCGAF
eukprot:COSAG01_NODE_685_length_14250_cov_18.752032_8_plen_103_part_00